MSTQNTDDAIYEEAERWPYFSVSLKYLTMDGERKLIHIAIDVEDFDHAHKYADVAARIAAKIAAEDDDGFDKYPHAEIWGETRSWESLDDYAADHPDDYQDEYDSYFEDVEARALVAYVNDDGELIAPEDAEPDVDPNVDDRLERLEARFDRLDDEVSAIACRLFTDDD